MPYFDIELSRYLNMLDGEPCAETVISTLRIDLPETLDNNLAHARNEEEREAVFDQVQEWVQENYPEWHRMSLGVSRG